MTRRAWNWTRAAAIATVAATGIALLSCAWGGGITRGSIDKQIEQLTASGADHETRIRQVESTIGQMAVDIKYIRKAVEHGD